MIVVTLVANSFIIFSFPAVALLGCAVCMLSCVRACYVLCPRSEEYLDFHGARASRST